MNRITGFKFTNPNTKAEHIITFEFKPPKRRSQKLEHWLQVETVRSITEIVGKDTPIPYEIIVEVAAWAEQAARPE